MLPSRRFICWHSFIDVFFKVSLMDSDGLERPAFRRRMRYMFPTPCPLLSILDFVFLFLSCYITSPLKDRILNRKEMKNENLKMLPSSRFINSHSFSHWKIFYLNECWHECSDTKDTEKCRWKHFITQDSNLTFRPGRCYISQGPILCRLPPHWKIEYSNRKIEG